MTLLFAQLFSNLLTIVEGIAIATGALIGAKASHGVVRGGYRLAKREPTWRAALASRLTGGIGAGVLVYMLFAGFGLGPGFGPGSGGLPGGGSGDGPQHFAGSEREPIAGHPESTQPAEARVPGRALHVMLLGDKSDPKFEAPDKLFAIADDSTKKALNVEGVIARCKEMKQQGALKEVELVLARDPDNPQSSLSTTLENAAVQLDQLRKGVREDIRVPFWQPDPANPFKDRVRYDPPATGTAP